MSPLLLQAEIIQAPWVEMITKTGPFGLVIVVVVWVLRSLVPKFHETLQKTAEGAERMMAKQEEGGSKIIAGILEELKTSREAFALALRDEQRVNTENTMRLYDAIERGNRLLLYLIAKHHGGQIPETLGSIFSEQPRTQEPEAKT